MKVHDSVAVVIYNVTRSVLIFVKQFRPAVLLAASLSDPSSTVPGETSVTGYTLELCAGILDKTGLCTSLHAAIGRSYTYKYSTIL
jgi:UDP-sugar diphosphatase